MYFYVFSPPTPGGIPLICAWMHPDWDSREYCGGSRSSSSSSSLFTSWINSGIHYQNVSQFKSRPSSWIQYRCRNTSKRIKRNGRPLEQMYKNHSNGSGFVSMQYEIGILFLLYHWCEIYFCRSQRSKKLKDGQGLNIFWLHCILNLYWMHARKEILKKDCLGKPRVFIFFPYYPKRYKVSLYFKDKLKYKNDTMAYIIINSHYRTT